LKHIFAALLLALVYPFTALASSAAQPAARDASAPACASPEQAVNEQGFVQIGGIAQWITIKGDDCANPIVLLVHGGPGNPMSLFADTMYAGWEKHVTLVQWDQRGAGMTYGKNRPSEDTPLTFQQIRDDGIEVATYLTRRLGQRKVIVMGGSWSSIIAIHMIKARPDLFTAYLGWSQMVSYKTNPPDTYSRLLTLARAAGDTDSVAKLEQLGAPPWKDPRSFGAMRRIDRKYEAVNTQEAPKAWWTPAPLYATAQAQADYTAGEDYSYLQFVGLHGDGMFATVDLPALGTDFQVPIFLLQGEEDLLTSPAIAKSYFDSLSAPRKAFVLLPRTGHDPNPIMIDAQYRLLTEQILPLTQ
jgi:pimeloyl-ACP methyl ester carboxylesterase